MTRNEERAKAIADRFGGITWPEVLEIAQSAALDAIERVLELRGEGGPPTEIVPRRSRKKGSSSKLMSIRGTAKECGVSASKILELEAKGIITAEVREGPKTVRFDVEKVRAILAKRSAAASAKTAAAYAKKKQPGMIPTY